MKKLNIVLPILITLFLVNLSFPNITAQENKVVKQKPSSVPIYSVSKYNPKGNPEEDLKKTVKLAKADGKRILLQVGGDWCGWCKLMNKYFHDNKAVAKVLAKDFIIMKVNYSTANRNKGFLSKYPKVSSYPYLFVLDSNGKLLHSQATEVLEKNRSYSEEAILKFLNKWAPKRSS